MDAVTRVPVVQQVVDSIKEYIMNGTHHVGDKLPTEKEFCETLSVGRGTLREAMRILQATGFVALQPGRGAFVSSMKEPEKDDLVKWFAKNEVEQKDVLEVRIAIEPLGIKLAIARCTQEDIKILRTIQTKAEDAAKCNDVAGMALCDEQFHSYIIECSNNKLLLALNRQISICLKQFRGKTFYIPQNVQNFIPAHAAILDAFEKRDSALGEKYMLSHLERVYADLEHSKEY